MTRMVGSYLYALLGHCIAGVAASSDLVVCRTPGLCVWNGTRGCCMRQELQEMYLYTLRNSLTGLLLKAPSYDDGIYNSKTTLHGGWPVYALTIIGVQRMELLHELLHYVYRNKMLTGDFLEAGVWRGGVSIYAKGFMKAYDIQNNIWVVDSFEGLPGKQHPMDTHGWDDPFFAVPLHEVKDAFRRHALLDHSVRFVQGWFGKTLPILRPRLRSLSLLHLDCDMYRSTLEVLCNTYDALDVGGVVLADDWSLIYQRRAILS
eukprot:TRINITY_DN31069_c0_g1_i1.p1 TRINITY_DN31069_c0_g1~~TRINITY_DN31069_c0_g1_i1.p1  ORF type:complete len:261 (-),score=18.97 TRINITY_DN31069_c0_g1_i1:68-850(-)